MSKVAYCIASLVVIHIIIGVAVGLALFTHHLHRATDYTDMAGDVRELDPGRMSIFCSAYRIQTTLVDGSQGKTRAGENEDSNSLPEVDVYSFANRPKLKWANQHFSLDGAGMLLTPGSYEYHSFHLNPDTEFRISVCSRHSNGLYELGPEIETTPNRGRGLYVYVLKGTRNQKYFISQIRKHPDRLPKVITYGSKYVLIPISKDCYDWPGQYTERLSVSINETDEYFIFYFNPERINLRQVAKIRYDLNRTEFDLMAYRPIATAVTRYRTTLNNSILISYRYSQNITGFHLYNIRTTFLCEAKVIMYVALFFFVPFVFIILLAFIVLCELQKRHIRINEGLDYSSYEPIYN